MEEVTPITPETKKSKKKMIVITILTVIGLLAIDLTCTHILIGKSNPVTVDTIKEVSPIDTVKAIVTPTTVLTSTVVTVKDTTKKITKQL